MGDKLKWLLKEGCVIVLRVMIFKPLRRGANISIYRSVPQKKPPPFAILALVQNTEGLINAGCDNFFRDYNLPAGCWWGLGPSTRCRWFRGGEMLPTLAVGWWTSALKGEEAGHFCKVAGVSIVDAGGPCSSDILSAISANHFTICHPTCSANCSNFSDISNTYMDSQKLALQGI